MRLTALLSTPVASVESMKINVFAAIPDPDRRDAPPGATRMLADCGHVVAVTSADLEDDTTPAICGVCFGDPVERAYVLSRIAERGKS